MHNVTQTFRHCLHHFGPVYTAPALISTGIDKWILVILRSIYGVPINSTRTTRRPENGVHCCPNATEMPVNGLNWCRIRRVKESIAFMRFFAHSLARSMTEADGLSLINDHHRRSIFLSMDLKSIPIHRTIESHVFILISAPQEIIEYLVCTEKKNKVTELNKFNQHRLNHRFILLFLLHYNCISPNVSLHLLLSCFRRICVGLCKS